MEELRRTIMQMMNNTLNDEQMEKLSNVLVIALHEYSDKKEVAVYDNSNEKILKKFIATKRLEGLAESTLEQYHRTASNMLEQIGKDIKDIGTDDIRYYLSVYQEQRKISKTSINNIRRYISSFFSFLEDEDVIVKSPVKRIKNIKQQKSIKKPFSDVEMDMLRSSAEKDRDRALVEFLYSTGCRVSEVVGIDIENIDFATRSCVVTGKGNKQRDVFLTEKTCYWLEKYLISRKDDNKALFVTNGNKRLKKQGIERITRKLGRLSNIEKCHPHRFRRTIATDLMNKGMPVQEVQVMLGHKSIDTTMIYCIVNKNNVKAAHDKYAA